MAISAVLGGPAQAADVHRLGGPDRIGTALALYEAHPETFGSSTVVVVRGDDYADAMTATPLAAAFTAPVVPVLPGKVDHRILDVLTRRGVTSVFIVGGENAVSAEAAAQLGEGRTVERVHGVDRYDTAHQVAHRIRELHGGGPVPVMLASGTDFADALVAGAAAARRGGVVMLTEGARMNTVTGRFLGGSQCADVFAIGGPAAAAMKEAGVTGESAVGKDRYETATLVNAKVYTKPAGTVLASGVSYADTLSAAALAAGKGVPLSLTTADALPPSTLGFLRERQPTVTVVGGPKAVSARVAQQTAALTGGALVPSAYDGTVTAPVNDRGEMVPPEVASVLATDQGTNTPTLSEHDIVLTKGVRGEAWSELGVGNSDEFVQTITHSGGAEFAWINPARALHAVDKMGQQLTLTAVPNRVRNITFAWYQADSLDGLATAQPVAGVPDEGDRLTHTVTVGKTPVWVKMVATASNGKRTEWGPVEVRARDSVDQSRSVTPQFAASSNAYKLWTQKAHLPFPVRGRITNPQTGEPLTPADGRVQFLVDCKDSCTQGKHVYGRVVDGTYDAATGTWEGAFVARIATDFSVRALFISNDPAAVRSAVSKPVTHTVKWLTAEHTKRLKNVVVDQARATPEVVRGDDTTTLSARVTRTEKDGTSTPVRAGSVVFYAGNYRLCTAETDSVTADGVWSCDGYLGQWADGLPMYAKYIEPYEQHDPATAAGVAFDNAEAVYDFPTTRFTFRVRR